MCGFCLMRVLDIRDNPNFGFYQICETLSGTMSLVSGYLHTWVLPLTASYVTSHPQKQWVLISPNLSQSVLICSVTGPYVLIADICVNRTVNIYMSLGTSHLAGRRMLLHKATCVHLMPAPGGGHWSSDQFTNGTIFCTQLPCLFLTFSKFPHAIQLLCHMTLLLPINMGVSSLLHKLCDV